MAKKNGATRRPNKFIEELPCRLSRDAYETIAELLAKQINVVAALKEEKKAADQDFKERILLAERELGDLREAVETHDEKRQVECVEEIDFDRNRAKIIRLDTNEVVRERAIDGDERAALAQEPLIPDGDQPENRA